MRNRTCLHAFWIACAPCWLVAATPTEARAGSFAPDGSFAFDPNATFTEGFENYVVDPQLGLADKDIVDADDALEGKKIVHRTSGSYSFAGVPLTLPSEQKVYQATLWLRGSANVGAVITYDDDSPGEFAQAFPTGRMTSDGWIEMQTLAFPVDGPRGVQAVIMMMGRADMDAIEVTHVKDVAFQGATACTNVKDPVCGPEQLCTSGWCRNSASWVPPVPPGERRALLAEYLQNRIRFFFGPHANRKANLDAAMAELSTAATTDGRWRFWNGFATAMHRMQDWHSSTSNLHSMLSGARRTLNACFFEGDADLSRDQAPSDAVLPDLLVSHAGADHNWGLKQGDRLVAVDGMHPIEWMRSLAAYDWQFQASNDPNTLSDYAARLRESIPTFARSVTVVRCDGLTCEAPEDVLISSIPDDVPDEYIATVYCDQRPLRVVKGIPEDHAPSEQVYGGLVVGTEPDEKIYGMSWEYLIGSGPNDTGIRAQIAKWADARGVLLDHRTGYGGTTVGPDPLIGFVRPPKTFLATLWREDAFDDGPADQVEGLALFNKRKADDGWQAGSNTAKTDVPVALMLTLDGSASDFFAYAMKGAPKVRLFGPHGTVGAFSSLMGLSYWGLTYQMGCGDSLSPEGLMVAGHGVEPDEVVWPKQSDLVVGKDTLVQAALSWIRSELEP